MRIERELMRGAGPVAVLKLLESGDMYGYELVKALSDRSQGILDMGQSTLYPMLYNLEAKGFVSSQWRDGDSARKRKYYTLSGKGKKRLISETEQWRSVAQAMQSLGILTEPQGASLSLEGGTP